MDGNVYYKKNWVTPGTSNSMWNKNFLLKRVLGRNWNFYLTWWRSSVRPSQGFDPYRRPPQKFLVWGRLRYIWIWPARHIYISKLQDPENIVESAATIRPHPLKNMCTNVAKNNNKFKLMNTPFSPIMPPFYRVRILLLSNAHQYIVLCIYAKIRKIQIIMLFTVRDYKMMFRIKHPRKNQKNAINILYLQTFMYIM